MFSMRNSSLASGTPKSPWIVAAAVIASWQAPAFSAQSQTNGQVVQVSEAHAEISRDPVRTAIERLSQHEIMAFYARCADEVAGRKLAAGEVMICSIVYDVLLNKHFSGNFDQLLAWSRAQSKHLRHGK